jgi:hypothetical protein
MTNGSWPASAKGRSAEVAEHSLSIGARSNMKRDVEERWLSALLRKQDVGTEPLTNPGFWLLIMLRWKRRDGIRLTPN